MASKTRKASRERKSSATRIAGLSSGKVTETKVRARPAPSMLAASYTSSGMVCRPASRIKATNGVVFQTSTRMAACSAVEGEPSQSMPGASRCSRP